MSNALGSILRADLPDLRISSQTVAISPEMASALLSDADPRYQRESQQATIARYADAMRQGYWHISTIRLATIKKLPNFFIIDGKHRLNAVRLADLEQEMQVEIVMCDDETEVAALAAVADRGKQRTAVDVAEITGLTSELEIGREYAKLHAAIGQIFHAFTTTGGGGVRQQLAYEVWQLAAKDWLPYFREYYSVLDNAANTTDDGQLETVIATIKRRMMQPAFVALGMILLRSQKDKASEFLTKIARGYIPGNPNEPIRKIVNLLAGNQRAMNNAATLVRTIAVAWNSFIQDQQLRDNLRPVDRIEGIASNKVPVFLLGTPYQLDEHQYYTPTPHFPVFYRSGGEVSPASDWTGCAKAGDPPRWRVVYEKADKVAAAARQKALTAERAAYRVAMKAKRESKEAITKADVQWAERLGLKAPKLPKVKEDKPKRRVVRQRKRS